MEPGAVPVAFVAAFVIGEGLFAWLGGSGGGDAAIWVLAALLGLLAILVFVLPGLLTYRLGRRAEQLGRSDGMKPAITAVTLVAAFVGINMLSFIAMVIFG